MEWVRGPLLLSTSTLCREKGLGFSVLPREAPADPSPGALWDSMIAPGAAPSPMLPVIFLLLGGRLLGLGRLSLGVCSEGRLDR